MVYFNLYLIYFCSMCVIYRTIFTSFTDTSYLQTYNIIYMLMILSEENDTCRTLLDDIKDIKSIVFFAIYFQSGFLFKYIKERVIKNVDEIANILQVSIFCQGEMHQFSNRFLRIYM